MLNLMKLELRRMDMRGMLYRFLLISAGIIGILLIVGIDSEAVSEIYASPDEMMNLMGILIMSAFVIHASVLISNMVVEEFRNKTIAVLFMYPIDRKKLLMAKLVIVTLLTFGMILLSYLVVFYAFYLFNHLIGITPFAIETGFLVSNAAAIIGIAFACAGMSLIPLYFGMKKYSVPATITSSIIIVAILSSTAGDIGANLFSVKAIPIILGISGFLISFLVVGRAVKADL